MFEIRGCSGCGLVGFKSERDRRMTIHTFGIDFYIERTRVSWLFIRDIRGKLILAVTRLSSNKL